jgi:hypothetical protein
VWFAALEKRMEVTIAKGGYKHGEQEMTPDECETVRYALADTCCDQMGRSEERSRRFRP